MLHISLHKIFILAGMLIIGLASLSAQATIVASVKPIGFIAATIADGVTSVSVLLPDGASVHSYALRPSDIKNLKNAELVVWVGPDMEAFMSKAISNVSILHNNIQIDQIPGVQALLLRGVEHAELGSLYRHIGEKKIENSVSTDRQGRHYHGEYNMHLWMSPDIAKKIAIAIHAKLLQQMPISQDKLDANLRYFQSTLFVANDKIHKQLAPFKDKGYLVFHDAYTYFEKHYGLSPTGYFTINPEIQPGAKRLHHIRMKLIEQKGICIFAEPQLRPTVMQAISRGTDVRSGILDPLGASITLSKDSYVQFLVQLSDQYTSCFKGD
ncbi:zinc ABC transporter substrate-binding protein ZnuA [Candidatus Erwinia haradaeae]|uniref:High-affinity zinc uptake system protein ZnuA n=1 Tax=Candidatus Erwinia haradaeae TaxID=1922217 RepID=A0A451D9Y9_9GAMM|nr:zinc ABC transporter substrate-binding protein ZnuA [Candidatus Erwinia haradaeae]VFP83138.1 High-affinity zinc uptake system protein ZnuA [Candidatus Erwinia haradaeae]